MKKIKKLINIIINTSTLIGLNTYPDNNEFYKKDVKKMRKKLLHLIKNKSKTVYVWEPK